MSVFSAGSRLEKAILDGPDALNRFISAGEIEQLNDIVNRTDDIKEEPNVKKSRFDRVVNHNAQIIYKENNAMQNQSQSNSFIPPLMAINVEPDMPNIGNNDNFRMPPGVGDMHGWAPPPPPPPGGPMPPMPPGMGSENWAGPPMFGPNGQMGPPMNGQPPSLLNLNVAPPFGDMSPNNCFGPPGNFNMGGMGGPNMGTPNMGGGGGSGQNMGSKRRNRDSDGNRISRFDNNEDNNRSRRSGSGNSSGNNWAQNSKRR